MRKIHIEQEKSQAIQRKIFEKEQKHHRTNDSNLPSITGNISEKEATETSPSISKRAFKFENYIGRRDPFNISKSGNDILTYIDTSSNKKKL
jgi:hypothetical protein